MASQCNRMDSLFCCEARGFRQCTRCVNSHTLKTPFLKRRAEETHTDKEGSGRQIQPVPHACARFHTRSDTKGAPVPFAFPVCKRTTARDRLNGFSLNRVWRLCRNRPLENCNFLLFYNRWYKREECQRLKMEAVCSTETFVSRSTSPHGITNRRTYHTFTVKKPCCQETFRAKGTESINPVYKYSPT
jgi:hypothetical protein